MKMSSVQKKQRLQVIQAEVKALAKGVQRAGLNIKRIKNAIIKKKDQSKIDGLRKKLGKL